MQYYKNIPLSRRSTVLRHLVNFGVTTLVLFLKKNFVYMFGFHQMPPAVSRASHICAWGYPYIVAKNVKNSFVHVWPWSLINSLINFELVRIWMRRFTRLTYTRALISSQDNFSFPNFRLAHSLPVTSCFKLVLHHRLICSREAICKIKFCNAISRTPRVYTRLSAYRQVMTV